MRRGRSRRSTCAPSLARSSGRHHRPLRRLGPSRERARRTPATTASGPTRPTMHPSSTLCPMAPCTTARRVPGRSPSPLATTGRLQSSTSAGSSSTLTTIPTTATAASTMSSWASTTRARCRPPSSELRTRIRTTGSWCRARASRGRAQTRSRSPSRTRRSGAPPTSGGRELSRACPSRAKTTSLTAQLRANRCTSRTGTPAQVARWASTHPLRRSRTRSSTTRRRRPPPCRLPASRA